MNQIKQGYKQIKVGIIPEDWEIVKLGKLTTVETGKTPLRSNKQFWDNGTINWATTTEVNETYIVSTNEKITNQAVAELKMKILPINTILLAMYGQGKTRGKVALLRIESTINQAFASIKPNKNYSTNFIFNYLDKSYEKIRDLSHGSNQDNLNLDIVKALQIPLPPLKEQEKIAEILTTWDEAITKQIELLEAKELQKKGLMQKLLRGEVRFSGFSDEWEEVRLGEICKITTGKLNANAMVENGEYTFFTCARDTYKIDEFAFDTEALLVSGNGANVGYIHYFNGKFNAYQRTYVLDGFKHNIFLIKYLLDKYLSLQISREKNEGNTPYITLPTLTKMKLKLPSLAEQQKIAEVLSLVDDEINLLKNELEELKLQKKALMQKLLTGEVRVKV